MARIAVGPEWVAILDFETRLPSALIVAGHDLGDGGAEA